MSHFEYKISQLSFENSNICDNILNMDNRIIEEKLDLLDILIPNNDVLESISDLTSPYLLNYIKNGQHEQVKEIILKIDFDSLAEKFSNVALTNAKYIGYGIVALSSAAASLGGLPKTDAKKLVHAYLQNELNFKTTKDVMVYVSRICYTLAKKVYDNKFSRIQTPIVFHAANYINENLEKRILNGDVAKQTNCSVQYLNKLFKEELGVTISQYVIQEKIKCAKSMIASGKLPTSIIYKKLTFCSQSHFTQTFKKEVGLTPSQYKRKLISENKLK